MKRPHYSKSESFLMDCQPEVVLTICAWNLHKEPLLEFEGCWNLCYWLFSITKIGSINPKKGLSYANACFHFIKYIRQRVSFNQYYRTFISLPSHWKQSASGLALLKGKFLALSIGLWHCDSFFGCVTSTIVFLSFFKFICFVLYILNSD